MAVPATIRPRARADREHRQRLAIAVIVGATLLLPGCFAPSPESASDPDTERRAAFRDRLRLSLGEDYGTPLEQPGTEQIQRGAKLYGILCQSCHGRKAGGNGRSARMLPVAPPDLSDPATAFFFSDRAKLEIIANGVERTPMIGWKGMLDERERLDILLFMNTLIDESGDLREPL
jgi:mono/diheme cytochrome c family protein